MKNQRSVVLFFTMVVLFSFSFFVAFSWIKKHESQLPYYGGGKMETTFSSAESSHIPTVPAFSFLNQDGKMVNENFVKNKIWVANFFFTNCGTICPKMSNHLQTVQQTFLQNDEVKIISFSCDPERDSATQLKFYSKNYQANNLQWQFLTGDKKSLYRFARKGLSLVATDGDGGENDFIHSQNLVLIDKKGFIRGYYDGTDEAAIQQLIIDIKKLL
ncbi:MAG: hypothetical protein RL708_866 [Bacteroidota bacterium]|jgi:protein SCO1/2